MKKHLKYCIAIISAIILASCSPVYAMQKDEFCVVQSSLGMEIMKARQNGMTIVRAMQIVNKGEDVKFNAVAKSIVQMAYAKPRFSTEDFKERMTTDFGTEVYNLCMIYSK